MFILSIFPMVRVLTKFCSTVLLISLFSATIPLAFAEGKFKDVPADNLYFKPIEYFAALGVLEGYKDTDGKAIFKPDQKVNRAEAIKMILAGSAKSRTLEAALTVDVFPDVKKGDWFATYVKKAKEEGIVKGDDKTGKFDPGRSVNKSELLKMALLANSINTAGIVKELPNEQISADVANNAWFYPYVLYGKEFGIIFPNATGKMDPAKELSRGEVAEIMYNTAKVVKGGPTQELLSRTEAKIFSSITKINLNDYDGALSDITKAKTFAERTLLAAPSEVIVQEAHKVTYGFGAAIEGFKAWKKDKNLATAKAKAEEAAAFIVPVTHLTELKKSLETLIGALRKAK